MRATELTLQQVERLIRKIAQKFPKEDETTLITDIHIKVSQESGEVRAFDDDDNEITHCVIDEWIENTSETFFENTTLVFRKTFKRIHSEVDNMGIIKPFSFVLEDDENEHIAELYYADDDTIIIGGDLMAGLDKDLNDFFNELLKD